MNHRFFSLAALALVAVAVCTGGAFAQLQSVGYMEDFETFTPCGTSFTTVCPLPNGWTNLTTDNRDWLPDSNGTGSSGTGPSVDHTLGTGAGIYLYTETSGGAQGADAIMESPRLDALGVAAPVFSYWYHMLGSPGTAMGDLHTDVREIFNEGMDGDANATTFMSASANFGAMHVGSNIVISGSAMGNNGSYAITSINSANSVEVTPAFLAVENTLSYLHELTTLDVVPALMGNMGDTWFQQQVIPTLTRGGTVEQFQAIIRGVRGTSFTSDMAVDDFFYDQLAATDLALTQISAPAQFAASGTMASVTVDIFNNGVSAQTGFAVQYDVNLSGSPVIEMYSGPAITTGQTVSFTFSVPFTVAIGANVVDAMVLLGDADPSNDSATSTTTGLDNVASFPYFEDFEAGPGLWNTSGANNSWAFGTPAKAVIMGASSGINCWTTGGLTGQYPNNEQSQLLGPNFDFSALTSPTISFDIWWDCETSWDGMVLQSSIDSGVSWQNVGAFGDPDNWYNDDTIDAAPGGSLEGWTGTGVNGSGGWVTALHDLVGLGGQSSVFLRFAFATDTSSVADGVAIDDISVFEPIVGAGQAPQFGVALMDISNAVDTTNGSFPVSSGLNGPYTTSVMAGSSLDFHFEGAPMQAILLLSGPTNVGLLNLMGIGQFDIGTGLDMTGFPTGVLLVADGNSTALPGAFFRTNTAGSMDASLTMPAFPMGYVTTFQAVMFTGTASVIAFSNAVELNAL